MDIYENVQCGFHGIENALGMKSKKHIACAYLYVSPVKPEVARHFFNKTSPTPRVVRYLQGCVRRHK